MKRLLILRHAKSDWHANYGEDHERPLNERGTRSASEVGRFLTRAGVVPDLVVSSTAVRALTTAQLAKEAGGWDCALEVAHELYGASVPQYLGVAAGAGGDAETLLLASHQPTCGEVVRALTGALVRFPTAGVASVLVEISSWQDLPNARYSELEWFLIPRLLTD